MLECKHLRKSYKERVIVEDLSFRVEAGEAFALLGSNGAGKTTTIKMILNLIRKDSGMVEIEEGMRIGYSPETPYFPPYLTAKETLNYYAKLQKIEKEERQHIVSGLLDTVGLEDSKTKVKNYSKGMLQRLALAQALIGDPEILILDEPTAGLDALGRREMMILIKKMKKAGKTILINSHILNDIERVCDRGIILDKGKVMGVWDSREEHNGKSLEDIFGEFVARGDKRLSLDEKEDECMDLDEKDGRIPGRAEKVHRHSERKEKADRYLSRNKKEDTEQKGDKNL